MSLRFVAFNGKSFTSKLIRFVTRSTRYSHVGYLSGEGTLIECWPTKTNRFQNWMFSKFTNHSIGTEYEVWQLDCDRTTMIAADACYKVMAKTPTKYNWIGCLAFVFKSINSARSGRLFCSEGCVKPLVVLLNWNRIKPSHVSPQKFVELIQAMGGKLIRSGVVEKS